MTLTTVELGPSYCRPAVGQHDPSGSSIKLANCICNATCLVSHARHCRYRIVPPHFRGQTATEPPSGRQTYACDIWLDKSKFIHSRGLLCKQALRLVYSSHHLDTTGRQFDAYVPPSRATDPPVSEYLIYS